MRSGGERFCRRAVLGTTRRKGTRWSEPLTVLSSRYSFSTFPPAPSADFKDTEAAHQPQEQQPPTTEPPQRVLYVGSVWPEEESSAAGVRTWQLLRTMQAKGWHVHFASACKENKFMHLLPEKGIEASRISASDDSLDTLLGKVMPHFVLFDRFLMEEQYGWRVKSKWPDATRVIDMQDCHFLRTLRQNALAEGQSIAEIQDLRPSLYDDAVLREISSVHRSDLTFVISSFEHKMLQDNFHVPFHKLSMLPFCFNKSERETKSAGRNFQYRHHFVMLGNFRHAPNHDSVHWTKREVWPLIRRVLPQAELHVYGSYPDKDSMLASDPEAGFLVKGPIPAQHLRSKLSHYRINLAPLRFGAGIKGKIADGWISGTPCVTTPIGAEGMTATPSSSKKWGGCYTATTAEDLAETAVEIYNNEHKWQRSQLNGFQLLERLFDGQKNGARMIDDMLATRQQQNEQRAFVALVLLFGCYNKKVLFSVGPIEGRAQKTTNITNATKPSSATTLMRWPFFPFSCSCSKGKKRAMHELQSISSPHQ